MQINFQQTRSYHVVSRCVWWAFFCNVENQPALLHAAFSGAGVILSIEVDDVDTVHTKLKRAGALKEIVIALRDEPWGQRHFLCKDPAGTLLDVFQMIPPTTSEYLSAYSDSER